MFLKKNNILTIASIIVVLITFLCVYRSTLFDFLIADDFLLMGWTYQAIAQPKMLLEQYFTIHPLVATGFYRPILSTILWLGYKAWGTNGLYFRLLNMSFELLSGLMLGLVTLALNKNLFERRPLRQSPLFIWALFSATLFVLYPLHSESVNWITVMTNPLIALFSLFSLWSYIRWRSEKKEQFLTLSILSTILALLTKETAATLPATIFVYELTFLHGDTKDSDTTSSNRAPIKIIYDCVVKTLPYWSMLVLYFCLRKMVLGEFIAGYPDYMCPQNVVGWLHGLRDIFVPINFLLIGKHSFIFKAWYACLLMLVSLTVIATIRADKNQRKVIYFLVFWFMLALAPSYKIFPSAMNTIVGSRLAYLSTAPLCIFLTYGLALSVGIRHRFLPLMRCLSIAIFALAAAILYINNSAWAEGGIWTGKVMKELQRYYQKTKDDPLTYIVGLPMGNKTGIYCLGMLRWVTLRPFFDRDLVNCVRLEDEPYISLMSVKEAINNGKCINLLYWDAQNESLRCVTVPAKNSQCSTKWQGNNLKQITHISFLPSASKLRTSWLSDGRLELKAEGKENEFAILDFTLPELPCWSTDFLALKLQFVSPPKNIPLNAKLYFTNSLVNQHSTNTNVCLGNAKSIGEEQEIFFPLQNLSTWSMGGKCSNIQIVLSIGQGVKIKEILIPETRSLVPDVNFKVSTDDRPGQLRLGPKSPYPGNVYYDVHSIKHAEQIVLEATQVAIVQGRAIDAQKVRKSFLFRKQIQNLHGHFTLHKMEFPTEPAIYRAWLKALDKEGNEVGFQSNVFYIRTDY